MIEDRKRRVAISILIATSGRVAALRETLHSLCGVAIPHDWTVELLLVENGARSGAEELIVSLPLRTFTIRHLFEPVAGKSHAINLAVSQARGEILLFTDDDVRFPADWVVQMCQPLVNGEGSVVVGGCRLAPHLLRSWMSGRHRGLLASTEYLCDDDPSEFAGVNMACLREVFDRVPQLDGELGGGGLGNCEDTLFAFQLKEAGLRFASRTRVHLEHHPAASRLSYGAWINATQAYGQSLAYVSHHWLHERLRFVRLRLLYFLTKLHLRLLLHRRRSLEAEGMPAWELSYRTDVARLHRYLHERRRPRNYGPRGLIKAHPLTAGNP